VGRSTIQPVQQQPPASSIKAAPAASTKPAQEKGFTAFLKRIFAKIKAFFASLWPKKTVS
jgi:hypothetical protein